MGVDMTRLWGLCLLFVGSAATAAEIPLVERDVSLTVRVGEHQLVSAQVTEVRLVKNEVWVLVGLKACYESLKTAFSSSEVTANFRAMLPEKLPLRYLVDGGYIYGDAQKGPETRENVHPLHKLSPEAQLKWTLPFKEGKLLYGFEHLITEKAPHLKHCRCTLLVHHEVWKLVAYEARQVGDETWIQIHPQQSGAANEEAVAYATTHAYLPAPAGKTRFIVTPGDRAFLLTRAANVTPPIAKPGSPMPTGLEWIIAEDDPVKWLQFTRGKFIFSRKRPIVAEPVAAPKSAKP